MVKSAKLDDLDLVLVRHVDDEPSKPIEQLRTILSAWTGTRRSIVEHKVPGKEASVLQDLGRHSLRFGFLGEFMGPEAKTVTETLWQKFHKGKVVPFSSDMVALVDVTKVVIERLNFEELAGDATRFRYQLILREYKEPTKAEKPAPSQSQKAKQETEDEADDAAASVNYITGKVVDQNGGAVEDAKVMVKGDDGEFETQTDENGVYRQDNLEPGTYKVTVDAPGYEDQEEEVEIKSSGETEEGEETEEAGEGSEESEGPEGTRAQGETEAGGEQDSAFEEE